MILKQNVGIDISKDSFNVCLSTLDNHFEKNCLGQRQFNNTLKGFKAFISWIEKKKDESVSCSYTMEFTGTYYEQLAYFLIESERVVYIVIPSKAKKYFESQSISSKTDKVDAQFLSWMGLERQLKQWKPLSSDFLNLRTLTREREELLKEKTIISNRLHASDQKAVVQKKTNERYQQRLIMVENQLAEVLKDIKELIKADEALSKKIDNLISIPGVSIKTAATIVAETNGFSAILNLKQLTSYAGLDVKHKQSGTYRGRSRISKQGNSHIRRALYFPAFTAIRYNVPLTVFFERVNAKKEKTMIAGVGVQRKLLGLMYTIWKNDTKFDEDYALKNKVGQPLKDCPTQDSLVTSFDRVQS